MVSSKKQLGGKKVMRTRIEMESNDGCTNLHGFLWMPDEVEPKAILQIAHGMVEHIERYDEFAKRLTKKGYVVVGYDHVGHGDSIVDQESYGYFGKKGAEVLIQDIRKLYKRMKVMYPELPYFLMGHSMGSFLVRRYLTVYGGEGLAGAIIMGTGRQRFPVALFGVGVTKGLKKLKGDRYRSSWVNELAFGGYNRTFSSIKTGKDWLSRDKEQVKKYCEDPKCQFIFTVGAYHDLFKVLCAIEKKSNLKRMKLNLPIFFVAGEKDPVGHFGKGVKSVYKQYHRLGMKDLEMKLYPEDRHEILNEMDRECVYQDLYNWMEKKRKNSQI